MADIGNFNQDQFQLACFGGPNYKIGDFWQLFYIANIPRLFRVLFLFFSKAGTGTAFQVRDYRSIYFFNQVRRKGLRESCMRRLIQLLGLYKKNAGFYLHNLEIWDEIVTYMATVAYILFRVDTVFLTHNEITTESFPIWLRTRIKYIHYVEDDIYVTLNTTLTVRDPNTLFTARRVMLIHKPILKLATSWGDVTARVEDQYLDV